VICKICGGHTRVAFRHTVLRKHQVDYLQCQSCGFLQTEKPYWLDEAYSDAIVPADTGIMQRNLHLCSATSLLLWRLYGGEGKYLDAAGGYGLLTRLMRDVGFDYYWSDPHAQNLMARGFEATTTEGPFLAVTAYEVLEHLPDPVEFLSNLIRSTGARTLIVSTEVFSGEAPNPNDWWYYVFDSGQHISFYRRSTLDVIGGKLGLNLYSYRNVHMWTDRTLSQFEFSLMTHPRLSAVLSWVPRLRLQSKIWPDHYSLLNQ
jgi:hypothetical protein